MQNANTSVVVTHLGSWLLFASLPVVFIASQTGSTGTSNILQSWAYWLCLLYFIVLFYLHTYYLLPHLYRRNQKPLYFFSVAILLALLLIIKPFDRLMNEGVRQGQQHPIDQSDYKEKPPPHDEPFDKPPPPPVEQAPPATA